MLLSGEANSDGNDQGPPPCPREHEATIMPLQTPHTLGLLMRVSPYPCFLSANHRSLSYTVTCRPEREQVEWGEGRLLGILAKK